MTMGNKKNVPAIRFKGFTKDWKKQQLGDCADIIGGGTPATSNQEYWDGDINWYSPAEIGDKIFIDKSKRKITSLGLKESSAKILPIGTVLFSSRAGIGNTAILVKEGATNQGFQSIIPHKGKLDTYFIFSRTRELKKYGETNGAGSTFIEVSGKQMENMPIINPEIDEQEAIGNFFQNIDRLINTSQAKLDKLKNIQKACLEKMFPRNGSNTPELRFKGFTDEWDIVKIKELCSITTGKSNTQDQVEDGAYPFFIRSDKAVRSNRYLYDCEAVLTIGDGNIGKVFHYVNGKFDLHQRVYKMDNFINILGKYFYYYFSTMFYERAMSMTAKATVDSIRLEMISEMNIMMPISLDEQSKIAGFFSELDDLIAKTEQQINKLKNIKRACLDKMFVNRED
ncbi:restriction endonuclease subunit S [Alistipes indistinctus]|uniref:restriction endonuclease subunit S n=1 Tax=Alistipes indistinctus TaxID=626932 RepID=UPI0032C0BF6E